MLRGYPSNPSNCNVGVWILKISALADTAPLEFGYASMAYATASIAFLSFIVWAHHMFTVGLPLQGNLFFMYMNGWTSSFALVVILGDIVFVSTDLNTPDNPKDIEDGDRVGGRVVFGGDEHGVVGDLDAPLDQAGTHVGIVEDKMTHTIEGGATINVVTGISGAVGSLVKERQEKGK